MVVCRAISPDLDSVRSFTVTSDALTGDRKDREDGTTLGKDGTLGWRDGRRPDALVLPADLDRSLRHLDDADLDRLVEAATAEARRRGRQAGKTSGGRAHAKPASVTQGQEKPILAAFEAGLKPVAIAREFRLSRIRVDSVLAGVGQGRRSSTFAAAKSAFP